MTDYSFSGSRAPDVKAERYEHRQTFLFLVVGWLATMLLLGFGKVDYSQPLWFSGDGLQVWTYAKGFIDGFGFRFNPSLGFPGIQDSNFFPTFDFSYKFILWCASLFTSNPATSMHVLYLVGATGMYIASAASLLKIGFRPLFAVVGTVAVVVTPYFFVRAFRHDFLSLYYSVPAGGALAITIGTLTRDHGISRVLRDKTLMCFTLLVGTSGLYYGFYTCIFVCVAGLAASIQTRRIAPSAAALTVSAAIFVLLVVSGYNTGLLDVISGATPQIARSPAEQLSYGLNVAEAVHVFSDTGISSWAMAVYVGFMPLIAGSVQLFEWPGLLLTTVTLLSPVFFLSASRADGLWGRFVALSAALIAFGIIYSIRGGIAFYFNLFIAPHVRATARVIPFFGFFATVIVLSLAELSFSLRTKSLSILTSSALCASLLLATAPSVGTMYKKQTLFTSVPKNLDDLKSLRSMLLQKDAANLTAILELPHILWPESPNLNGYNPYSLQKPYILDTPGSKTKWSYGGASSQSSFVSIDALVKGNPANLCKNAAAAGFDGILIEKQPLSSEEVATFENGLLIGGAEKLFDDQLRALYVIRC